MKLFITRVWGFDPERWPVITFSLEGNRDRLLKESSPGDGIAFVGTLREPTPEPTRGKLLGMAEIGRIPVDTIDVIGDDVRGSHDYDEEGQFRWPKAIPMVRAWRFTPPPMLLDVLEEQLPYHATSQAVALSRVDAEAVLKLDTIPATLPHLDSIMNAKLLDKALAAGNPTTGPKPCSWTTEASRDADREAFTYAFRFGCSDIWKIGHAVDVNDRLKQVNCHIPTEVIPEKWNAQFRQRWNSETDAYDMEQRVLKTLEDHRTEGERVRCSEETLWSAWLKGIGA
ncbi:MAG: GIY-YIG nuclease family protein [Paracoccaceae bacterium]